MTSFMILRLIGQKSSNLYVHTIFLLAIGNEFRQNCSVVYKSMSVALLSCNSWTREATERAFECDAWTVKQRTSKPSIPVVQMRKFTFNS
jgi:hypothetical protein